MSEVKINFESEMTTYNRLKDELVKTIMVNYKHPDFPPRTLWIPKAEYSEEELRKRIKADLEEARVSKPRRIKL